MSYAAICSTKAASLYNLTIIQENIQDQQNNTTKFFVVVKDPTSREYTKKS
ncbi:hypothetical protein GW750_07770 [bacterium]|nr:hypothetical protein [bacterium]